MRSSPRTSAKLAGLVLALLAGFGLKAFSAEDEAEVILSHLPAKTSAEYKALRDLATPTVGQDLRDDWRGDVDRARRALRGVARSCN